MGFFSSRRAANENQSYMHNNTGSSVSVSMVQVIRSRFYGKYKGKERETHPPSMTRHNDRSLYRLSAGRSPLGTAQVLPPPPDTPRAHTDVITTTLAQRLDELAAANSEGLLDDDEYRLLRQNIFERLASGSSVPQEAPLVPIVSHPPSSYSPAPTNVRSPSVRSKSSISSVMSTLFKRSSRVSTHTATTSLTATTDDASVFSGGTSRRPIPPYMRSDVSLASETPSHMQYLCVNRSTSSINDSINGGRSSPYRSPRRFQTGPGATPPPSSFRLNGTSDSPSTSTLTPSTSRNPRTSSHSPSHSHPFSLSPSTIHTDPDNPSSSELKRQIATLEAEGGRLVDAFNGLELSALTRHHPPRTPSVRRLRVGAAGSDYGSRGGGSEHGGRGGGSEHGGSGYLSTGRGTPCDADDQSNYSASGASSVSQPRSQPQSYRNPSLRAPPSTLSASARKRSVSSMSSRAHVPMNGSQSSPRLTLGKLRELGSVSSVNLVRESSVHNSPVREVPDDDISLSALENELSDIRRRRGEVTARYQVRLEYLRAQLRAAELKEKLMRK